jgi:sporulation protein YlmC with PRC-barrel domain
MIDTSNIAALIGADVLDSDGEKLGTVSQIFVSPLDKQPRWVAIHHGLGHDWIAPLVDAVSGDESITLPFDKKTVKKSPKTTFEEGVSAEQDAALSEHYDRALIDAQNNDAQNDDAQNNGDDTTSGDRSEQKPAE